MTFAESLRNYLENDRERKRRGALILRVLMMQDRVRRRHLVDAMERHAAAVAGVPLASVYWDEFNWLDFGEKVLRVLLAILPIYLEA